MAPIPTARNKAIAAKRRESVGNPFLPAVLVLALTFGIGYGAHNGVHALSLYGANLIKAEARLKSLQATNLQLESHVATVRRESQQIASLVDEWKASDAKLPVPRANSAATALGDSERQMHPRLLEEGSLVKNPGTDTKPSLLEVQTAGSFSSLLTWLITIEHNYDAIRVTKAVWVPRGSDVISLNLSVEVEP